MSKTQMSAVKKNYLGLGIMAILSALVIVVSGPLYRSMSNHPDMPLADGVYTYKDEQPDDNGFYSVAMDAVSSVSINAYPFVNGLSDCLDQAAIR